MLLLLNEVEKYIPREPSGSVTTDFNDGIQVKFVGNDQAGKERVVYTG